MQVVLMVVVNTIVSVIYSNNQIKMLKKSLKKFQQAFTLIELLVVATIIGVLLSIAIVSFSSAQKKSRDAKRKADLETLRQALILYRQDNGNYGDVSAGFADLTTALYTANYLTTSNIADPKNTDPYIYDLACTNGVASACEQVTLTVPLEEAAGSTSYVIRTP